MSNYIDANISKNVHDIIKDSGVLFFSLAVVAGIFTDYILDKKINTVSLPEKLTFVVFPLIVIVLILLLSNSILTAKEPEPSAVEYINIGTMLVTALYVLVVKTYTFHSSEVLNNEL